MGATVIGWVTWCIGFPLSSYIHGIDVREFFDQAADIIRDGEKIIYDFTHNNTAHVTLVTCAEQASEYGVADLLFSPPLLHTDAEKQVLTDTIPNIYTAIQTTYSPNADFGDWLRDGPLVWMHNVWFIFPVIIFCGSVVLFMSHEIEKQDNARDPHVRVRKKTYDALVEAREKAREKVAKFDSDAAYEKVQRKIAEKDEYTFRFCPFSRWFKLEDFEERRLHTNTIIRKTTGVSNYFDYEIWMNVWSQLYFMWQITYSIVVLIGILLIINMLFLGIKPWDLSIKLFLQEWIRFYRNFTNFGPRAKRIPFDVGVISHNGSVMIQSYALRSELTMEARIRRFIYSNTPNALLKRAWASLVTSIRDGIKQLRR